MRSPSQTPEPWPVICGCTATTAKWTSSQPCGWVRAPAARIRKSRIHLRQLQGRIPQDKMTTCWYPMFYWSLSMGMDLWTSGKSALLTSPSFPQWWVLRMLAEPVGIGSEPTPQPAILYCLSCCQRLITMFPKSTMQIREHSVMGRRKRGLSPKRMRRIKRMEWEEWSFVVSWFCGGWIPWGLCPSLEAL